MSDQLTQEQAKAEWDRLDQEDGSPAEHPVEPKAQDAEPAAPAEAQAPAEPAADPYADLPPMVRDEIAGLRALTEQMQNRLRNVEGNVGGLKSQLQAAKEVRSAGGDAPTESELRRAQVDPEAAARLRRDYPEFADGVSSLIQHELASRAQPEASGVSREDLEAVREEIRRELLVEFKHPDWKQTIATPVFAGWFQRQAPEIRMLGGSQDPRDAVRVLDLFEDDRKRANSRHQGLAAAAAIPQGAGRGTRVKTVDEMTPEEYWAHLDATGQ